MVIGECRECARPLHVPVAVHCDFCGARNAVYGLAPNVANAPADPALLALAKLGAMIHMESDPELDRAQFMAGTLAKVGNGVGNIPGITLLAHALLAPDGAASEGVTDG